jgi:hypothetical protein
MEYSRLFVGITLLLALQCADSFERVYVRSSIITTSHRRHHRFLSVKSKENFEPPPGYFRGLVESPLDFREDEQLDNITPNVKLVVAVATICMGLVGAFVALNLEPPPASYI